MKSVSSSFVLLAGKVAPKIKLITFILTLVLFVLAAGAPQATGSIGG
jgi:hypothetical protein